MATRGFTHLQFEALLTAALRSPNPSDFALAAMLGLLGLPIFEATSTDIADLGEEHGHRVLRVCGKGTKIVLVLLPPAVGLAIDRAVGDRTRGPVLLNSRSTRMDRHAATRRLQQLAATAGIQIAKGAPAHAPAHSLCLVTVFDNQQRRASEPVTCADRRSPSRCRFSLSQRTGSGSRRAQPNRYTNPVNTASADRRHTFVTTC